MVSKQLLVLCTIFISLSIIPVPSNGAGFGIRRKWQRFRSSGRRDAQGYVILEDAPGEKILGATRSILPSLQNNVEKWNEDSTGLFEAITNKTLVLLDGLKGKTVQVEKKYVALYEAFYPPGARGQGVSEAATSSPLMLAIQYGKK